MLSKVKKKEVLTSFFNAYYKVITCGIEFDEAKCSEAKLFFTYPESVSTDCLSVDYNSIDDGTYNDLINKLINSPKEVCTDMVKQFVVFASALSLIDDEASDDDDVDWWFEDLEHTRKLLPIKLFAKPRTGETMTANEVRERIDSMTDSVRKSVLALKTKFSGYIEV